MASVLSLLIVLLGLVSQGRLPYRELPDVDPPIVSVTTVFPGAAPEVVETSVTQPLENSLIGIEGPQWMADAAWLKPTLILSSVWQTGGAMVLSTINRTVKSLALAKVMAEYVLRWLPAGTHDWRKFVKPSELARYLRPTDMEIVALAGMTYNPLDDSWRLDRDLAVNYLAFAVKD